MAKTGGIGKDDLVSSGALKSIKELHDLLEAAEKELADIVKLGPSLDKSINKSKRISELTTQIGQLTVQINKLIAAQTKLSSANTKLAASANKNTTSTTRQEQATKRLELAQKRLEIQEKKLQQEEAKLNGTHVDSAAKTTKLSTAFGSVLRSAVRLTGAYLTLNSAVRLFMSIIKNTAELDSLNFTLKTIITNTFELAQTHKFLSGIIEKYGTDLSDTTRNYVRFRAAVEQSNLTVKQGQDIYESIAKASSALALSQEKTNDVFLALEQMLSKGSIMSEELRRQMGQHLPVAMGAMAKAAKDAGLSVSGTTGELLDLMKAGKVTADKVLPFFAKQVEEALGVSTLKKVDTLVAAQERLNTAWMNFVKALEATPGLTAAYNAISGFLKKVTKTIQSDEAKVQDGSSELISAVNDKLQDGVTVEERKIILAVEYNRLLEERAKLEGNVGKIQQERIDKEGGKTLSNFGKALARKAWGTIGGDVERFDVTFAKPTPVIEMKQMLLVNAYSDAIRKIKENWDDLVKVKEQDKNLETEEKFKLRIANLKASQAREFELYKDGQERLRQLAMEKVVMGGADELEQERVFAQLNMDEETNLTKFRLSQLDILLKAVKGNKEETLDVQLDKAKTETDLTEKTTAFKIKEYNRETNERMRTIERIKDAEIAAIEDKLSGKILGLSSDVNTQMAGVTGLGQEYKFEQIARNFSFNSLKATESALQDMLKIENLTAEDIKRINKDLFDTQKDIEEAKRYEIEKTARERMELEQAAFDFGVQSIGQTFAIFQNFQNARLEALDVQHEHEVNLAGDNLSKKLAADIKYDKEKRKLQKRAAILTKAQGAFDIIINTAVGVMNAMSKVITMPLIPWIVGMGAVSLATTLAAPIPAFERGGKHSGGPARFSEHGKRELFIPDSGLPFITPAIETIADMPSGTFIPHDEVSRVLANDVMNNFVHDVPDVDLSTTNSLLKSIANKETPVYSGGYKRVKANNINGRYVTRN